MNKLNYEVDTYNNMVKTYNEKLEIIPYRFCQIINMDNKQIKKEIYIINNKSYFDARTKGWTDIFENVLYKRRFNKLKKIKSNIQI